MGRRPIILPKGTFYKKSPLESRKTAFGLYCPVFHRLPPGYQKSPYIPPTRLRRRGALIQRIARSTHKIRPSDTSSHQAVYGAPPHNPAKGDFLQKVPFGIPKNSVWPLLSGFSSFAPRVSKITVHTAYPSSAPRCAYSAHREINPQNTTFGYKQPSGRIWGAAP